MNVEILNDYAKDSWYGNVRETVKLILNEFLLKHILKISIEIYFLNEISCDANFLLTLFADNIVEEVSPNSADVS